MIWEEIEYFQLLLFPRKGREAMFGFVSASLFPRYSQLTSHKTPWRHYLLSPGLLPQSDAMLNTSDKVHITQNGTWDPANVTKIQ